MIGSLSGQHTRVARSGKDGSVQSLELLDAIRESKDFGGADEGEVHGVPEEDNVLALVVREGDVLELAINNGGEGEFGSRLLDLGN